MYKSSAISPDRSGLETSSANTPLQNLPQLRINPQYLPPNPVLEVDRYTKLLLPREIDAVLTTHGTVAKLSLQIYLRVSFYSLDF